MMLFLHYRMNFFRLGRLKENRANLLNWLGNRLRWFLLTAFAIPGKHLLLRQI